MNCFWKMAVCLASGLGLATGLCASKGVASSGDPYEPIVTRNIFNLNPPKPHEVARPRPEPPAKITPDGIMTIFGTTQVLFKAAIPPRPPKPATEKSYILSEGQQQDDIEVKHIDVNTGMITFNNHGVVQQIALAKAPPINTPTPVVMRPGFHGPPGAPNRFNRGENYRRFGGRFGQNRNVENNQANSGENNSNTGMASSGFAAGGSVGGQNQQPLTPEEQTLLLAAEKAHAKEQGNPMWRIYPPTPLDKDAGTVNSAPPSVPSQPPP